MLLEQNAEVEANRGMTRRRKGKRRMDGKS
jgi:hypothetical protein